MVSILQQVASIIDNSANELKAVVWANSCTHQEALARQAILAGYKAMSSDINHLIALAKNPRVESWLNSHRDKSHRDAGGIAAVVELLDLLRSMA